MDEFCEIRENCPCDGRNLTTKKRREKNKKLMAEYRSNHKRCECCNSAEPKHTHHIEHFSKGGKDEFDNYLAVCIECHDELHPELPRFLKDKWSGNRCQKSLIDVSNR